MPTFARLAEACVQHVAHLGKMGQVQKDKRTLRQHLEMLAGRKPEVRKEIDGPQVPQPVRYLVEYWYELGLGRGTGAWGPAPLTWQDIAGWARVTGTAVTGGEAVVLMRMDRAFLSAAMPTVKEE